MFNKSFLIRSTIVFGCVLGQTEASWAALRVTHSMGKAIQSAAQGSAGFVPDAKPTSTPDTSLPAAQTQSEREAKLVEAIKTGQACAAESQHSGTCSECCYKKFGGWMSEFGDFNQTQTYESFEGQPRLALNKYILHQVCTGMTATGLTESEAAFKARVKTEFPNGVPARKIAHCDMLAAPPKNSKPELQGFSWLAIKLEKTKRRSERDVRPGDGGSYAACSGAGTANTALAQASSVEDILEILGDRTPAIASGVQAPQDELYALDPAGNMEADAMKAVATGVKALTELGRSTEYGFNPFDVPRFQACAKRMGVPVNTSYDPKLSHSDRQWYLERGARLATIELVEAGLPADKKFTAEERSILLGEANSPKEMGDALRATSDSDRENRIRGNIFMIYSIVMRKGVTREQLMGSPAFKAKLALVETQYNSEQENFNATLGKDHEGKPLFRKTAKFFDKDADRSSLNKIVDASMSSFRTQNSARNLAVDWYQVKHRFERKAGTGLNLIEAYDICVGNFFGDETNPLGRKLNSMMDRLHTAYRTQLQAARNPVVANK
jgi:hypothetical protein